MHPLTTRSEQLHHLLEHIWPWWELLAGHGGCQWTKSFSSPSLPPSSTHTHIDSFGLTHTHTYCFICLFMTCTPNHLSASNLRPRRQVARSPLQSCTRPWLMQHGAHVGLHGSGGKRRNGAMNPVLGNTLIEIRKNFRWFRAKPSLVSSLPLTLSIPSTRPDYVDVSAQRVPTEKNLQLSHFRCDHLMQRQDKDLDMSWPHKHLFKSLVAGWLAFVEPLKAGHT